MKTTQVLGLLMAATVAAASVHAQTFSKRKMEDLVEQILEQRTGTRDAEVECPVATPIGIGERAVCSATGRDGSSFSVELIQTDESGGVNFTVTDMAAVETLQPAALDFFERWKADDIEGIYDGGHETLRQATRVEEFAQLMRCTAADFGGLETMGETEGAAMHRGDGSGQILASMRFAAGLGSVQLNYQKAGDGWLLTGVSMPIRQVDFSNVTSDPLMRHAARLFERIDAGDWDEVTEMLSHELRQETAGDVIRQALDDPWGLGTVQRLEMTSYGRNAGNLPIVFAKVVRERGDQRVWLVFRSCGSDWKVRSMQLLDPATEFPAAAMSEVQLDIIRALGEKGVDVSLDCPGSEVAVMPGVVYTCDAAHDSGLTAPVEVSVGEEGDISWQLLGGADWDPLFE